MNSFRVFIQARMTSSRFPGKVLAPFRGRPMIAQVVNRIAKLVPLNAITVATSSEVSDDPLAAYLKGIGISVFRGSLEDVFTRFQLCLENFPCDWFFRICADSPLLDGALLAQMLPHRDSDVDLITNVQTRTFPRGHSVELLNAKTFASIDSGTLSRDEKEHVTKLFYTHPTQYRIVNLLSEDPALANQSFVVDTLEDLSRLELLPQAEAIA